MVLRHILPSVAGALRASVEAQPVYEERPAASLSVSHAKFPMILGPLAGKCALTGSGGDFSRFGAGFQLCLVTLTVGKLGEGAWLIVPPTL